MHIYRQLGKKTRSAIKKEFYSPQQKAFNARMNERVEGLSKYGAKKVRAAFAAFAKRKKPLNFGRSFKRIGGVAVRGASKSRFKRFVVG